MNVINPEDGFNADSLQRYIKAMELNTQWLRQRQEREGMQTAMEKPREEWEDDVSIQPSYMSVPDIGRQEEPQVVEIYQKIEEESPEECAAKRRMAVAGYISFGESMKAQSDEMEHYPNSLNKKG